jgi:hypothetical protein
VKRIKPIYNKLPTDTLVSTDLVGTILFDKNMYVILRTSKKELILMYANGILNDFRLMSYFINMIYVIIYFNPTVNFVR